jgi:plasmid stabilization system protein ParE
VKLRVGSQAQAQADKLEDWWGANRPSAPTLFTDELEATLRLLRTMPGGGIGWPTPRRPTLRRILMPMTQNHVNFRVDHALETVFVLAVWGAPRGRVPKL